MENPTTFDLNAAIQSWRENLAQSPAFQRENLNELESHLRDSVATLQSRGLSAEEAFMVAAKRIGSSRALQAEFAKCNRPSVWLERFLWMLLGIQVWGLANGFVGSATRSLFIFGWHNLESDYNRQEQGLALPVTLFTLGQLLSMAASAWLVWWLIFRKGGKWNQWLAANLQRRSSFSVFCVVASLLLLLAQIGITYSPAILLRSMGPAHFVELSTYQSYSMFIVQPLSIVAMLILTLFLIRKRASANAGPISSVAR